MHDVDAPLLEINDASVVLGGNRILDGLTLTIRAGEHTAILGPNGAGKSTLMKLLTLQVYPFASANGTPPIRVFGRDRWDVFDLRAQLGIVSADLHDRFVHGNAAGVITGHDAVLSGFFASQGLFSHSRVTGAIIRTRHAVWPATAGSALQPQATGARIDRVPHRPHHLFLFTIGRTWTRRFVAS